MDNLTFYSVGMKAYGGQTHFSGKHLLWDRKEFTECILEHSHHLMAQSS